MSKTALTVLEREVTRPGRPHRKATLFLAATTALSAVVGGALGAMLNKNAPATAPTAELSLLPLPTPVVAALTLPAPFPVTIDSRSPELPMQLDDAIDAALIINAGGEPSLVLVGDVEGAPDGHGKVEALDVDDYSAVLRRPVPERAVPAAAFARTHHREFNLFDAGGDIACRTRVKGYAIIGRYHGDFSSADGSYDWEVAGKSLVAELEVVSGSCEGASWGRDARLAIPEVAAVKEADEKLSARAIARLRALPAYKKRRADIRAELGLETEWDEGSPYVQTATVAGGETLVIVTAFEGCGEFNGLYSAVFRVDGKRLALVELSDRQRTIEQATDLDGDGDLDFITYDTIYRQNRVFTAVQRAEVPSYICPC